ncbi:MAG: DUF3137 domain-containing protein [Acidimicrobiales bacterium]
MVWLMLVGFVAFGVMTTVAFKRKADRNGDLQKLAAANGFVYTEEDWFASTRVPFQIFRLGNRSMVENMIVGQSADGAPVRLFDLTTWDEKQTEDGTQESHYRYMTCCLTETGHAFPHLVVQPDTVATRLLEKVGMPSIDLESEAFNRRFMVTSEDERFARMFLDPQMMELLLSTDGQFQFEVRGRWVLVAAPQLPAELCLSLVGLSTHFRELIPPVVREFHPDLPNIVEPRPR